MPQNVFVQKLRWPFDKHFGHDRFGVEPFDNCGIPQARWVIAQIMRNDCEHMETLVQLKGERGIAQIAVNYPNNVHLGGNLPGVLVVAAEA